MSDVLLAWTELDPIVAIFPADDAGAAHDWADRELRSKIVHCTLCCSYNDAVYAAKLMGKEVVRGKQKERKNDSDV